MRDARRTRRRNGLAQAERARDGAEDAVGAQDFRRWGQHVRVREGAARLRELLSADADADEDAAQAADAAAAAAGVAAVVGHEAEDAAEGRLGGVDAVLDAAPGVLEPDEVVHAELDSIHLVEAYLSRVGDDGGAGDPGVGDSDFGVRRLGFGQADGSIGGLVDGMVGHLALLRCVDAQRRFARFRVLARFEYGRFRGVVGRLERVLVHVCDAGVRLSSVDRIVSVSFPSTPLSVAT